MQSSVREKRKTVKQAPKERPDENRRPRPRLDDAELKRRALERWENEGGRPSPR